MGRSREKKWSFIFREHRVFLLRDLMRVLYRNCETCCFCGSRHAKYGLGSFRTEIVCLIHD
jgi:hypothetical protein